MTYFLQSLHLLRMRWCSQMADPPQSLHWLLLRWCSQMADPPQSLHRLLLHLLSPVAASIPVNGSAVGTWVACLEATSRQSHRICNCTFSSYALTSARLRGRRCPVEGVGEQPSTCYSGRRPAPCLFLCEWTLLSSPPARCRSACSILASAAHAFRGAAARPSFDGGEISACMAGCERGLSCEAPRRCFWRQRYGCSRRKAPQRDRRRKVRHARGSSGPGLKHA